MSRFVFIIAALTAALTQLPVFAEPPEEGSSPVATVTALDIDHVTRPDKRNLDQMVELGLIRVLVPYSRTFFYHDNGRPRGLAAHFIVEFERFVKREQKSSGQLITVVAVPVTRNQLLPWLAEGRGDIAAVGPVIRLQRPEMIEFSDSPRKVSEIIVTGAGSPSLTVLGDLAGAEVHVRPGSSYYQSLLALNERFLEDGKEPVQITLVSDVLDNEDMLEMVDAGLLKIVVADDWLANIWASVLPNLTPHTDLILRKERELAWAFRKDSPKLQALVNGFMAMLAEKNLVAQRIAGYERQHKRLKNATAGSEWKRFKSTIDLFKKYGKQYQFDYLMLAAQGYQESRLNQKARSPVGAIGIMQLMPATGREMRVGNVRKASNNVHAGVKYMRKLMDTYFKGIPFDERNSTLFALASYNAGPGRVKRLRTKAEERGLDPNVWFNNVELVVSEKVGREPVNYVRNVYKYYIAYKLSLDAQEARRKAAEAIENTTE